MDSAETFDKKKHRKEVNTAVADLQSMFDVMTHNYLLRSQVPGPEYQCLHPKIDGSVIPGDRGWSEQILLQDKLRWI